MKKNISTTTVAKNLSIRPEKTSLPLELNPLELSPRLEPVKLSNGDYIKIDHATLLDNIAIVVGWASEELELKFLNVIASESISRGDASSATGRNSRGFIVVIKILEPTSIIDLDITTGATSYKVNVRFSTTANELTSAMSCYLQFTDKLLSYFVQSRLFSQYLANSCIPLSPSIRSTTANGHLDMLRTFPKFGYVAYGWSIGKISTSFWLLTDTNEWFPLEKAIWFGRPDVADVFIDSFGPRAIEAGFFYTIKDENVANGSSVRLIAVSELGLFTVHETTSSEGPLTPLGYARWAFSLSVPSSRFFERIATQDGILVDHLIKKNRSNYPDEIDVWETEGMPDTPEVSVIVPLYGRADFVEYQLTKFSRDKEFTSGNVELIYVIDDPLLVEGLRQTCHQLTKLYKVPMRFIWGKINRGYSGANNLGIKYSSAKTVILLNSDVFPIESGWSKTMALTLQSDDSIGGVGAKLVYADGSIQHLGMTFEFTQEWKVWLNKHPGQGLDITSQSTVFDVEAATGACLAIRRDDLIQLGGMDEDFLIGDFEDSDLCLKLREKRGRIVVVTQTNLVHLERQSFNQLGSNDFRTNVVRYNAWRHSQIWGNKISMLKESQQ